LIPPSAYNSAIILSVLVGLMGSLANGSLGPLLQTKVPPEMQGRIFTILSSMVLGMMPIGLFLSAPIADHFGVQTAYLFGGILGVSMAIFGLMNKRLVTIDDQLPGGQPIEPLKHADIEKENPEI
jgi:DHA3 family macrolide efflux protein-like MFS transporter